MRLFSFDSLFMRALNFIADLVIMHVLWLVCCLPIVTAGASTTALYYTCMKRMRTKEGYITKNFFHSFRENFRQATILWLIMLAVLFLFVTDLRYAVYLNNFMGKIMLVTCSVFLIPCVLIAIYIFPVLAKFENTIFDNVKNALLMSIRHFPSSLLLLVIYGTFGLLLYMFPPFIGLMLIVGGGLMAYLTSSVFIQIFRKYIPDELEEDLEKSGEKFEQ